jgi:hypothetical protein
MNVFFGPLYHAWTHLQKLFDWQCQKTTKSLLTIEKHSKINKNKSLSCNWNVIGRNTKSNNYKLHHQEL